MKRFRLKNMRLDRVDLVTAGANPGAHVLITKFEAPDIVGEEMSNDVETVEAPEAPVEEVSMSQETPVETPAPVDTVAKADFEALQKANTELADRIAKMERERKQAEYVAKAGEYGNLGKADELGGMLLAASEGMTAEQYQLLERTLKAANAQVDKGALFAQFAKQDAEAVDVIEKIEQLAKAKVDAGAAATIEL